MKLSQAPSDKSTGHAASFQNIFPPVDSTTNYFYTHQKTNYFYTHQKMKSEEDYKEGSGDFLPGPATFFAP
jgi:hypothetical protein